MTPTQRYLDQFMHFVASGIQGGEYFSARAYPDCAVVKVGRGAVEIANFVTTARLHRSQDARADAEEDAHEMLAHIRREVLP